MAETTKNNSRTRSRSGTSRLGQIGESIRDRPLATAAVATAAAAAGAFFFARRSGITSDTVAKWGQDAKESFGNLTGQTTSDSDSAKQGATATAGISPSTKTVSPSGKAAGKLGDSGGTAAARSDNSVTIPPTGEVKTTTKPAGGDTGLDQTSEDQAKVGSVAYGA